MTVEAPSSCSSPEEVWTKLFDSLCERIGPSFARSETRERVKAYLRGLLSPIERKNGWQLAEEAGLPTPYAMQYLLNRAVWDSDEVRDQLQAYVRELMAAVRRFQARHGHAQALLHDLRLGALQRRPLFR